jgi:hypothetical protein
MTLNVHYNGSYMVTKLSSQGKDEWLWCEECIYHHIILTDKSQVVNLYCLSASLANQNTFSECILLCSINCFTDVCDYQQ